jgi:hypothetical protein
MPNTHSKPFSVSLRDGKGQLIFQQTLGKTFQANPAKRTTKLEKARLRSPFWRTPQATFRPFPFCDFDPKKAGASCHRTNTINPSFLYLIEITPS